MMGNFKKIFSCDNRALRDELKNYPELWNQHPLRTMEGMDHQDADDIWLRFNDLKKYKTAQDFVGVLDDLDCCNYEAWNLLPEARKRIYKLMFEVGGTVLGKSIITRLPPGGRITPHCDEGLYARTFDRFHITVDNHPGSYFICGGQEICMNTGDVYWFDASKEHEVINDSDKERITLIVDIGNMSDLTQTEENFDAHCRRNA